MKDDGSTSATEAGPAPSPTTQAVGYLRALLLMAWGVGLLTAMDATVKALAVYYPVAQIAFLRCVLALPVLAVTAIFSGARPTLRTDQPRLQVLRGTLMAATGLLFFNALKHLPLADTLAISFAAPFLIAALSWPLLGERVAAAGWAAILLGLAGVLVVANPGAELGVGAVLAVAAASTYALASLVLRRLGRTDSAMTTALWATVVPGAIYAALAIAAWRPPSPAHWPGLLAVGALGAFGSLAIGAAYRRAPASVLGAVEYSAVLWGVGIGLLVFAEVPGPRVLIGASLILASGVLLTRAGAAARPQPEP